MASRYACHDYYQIPDVQRDFVTFHVHRCRPHHHRPINKECKQFFSVGTVTTFKLSIRNAVSLELILTSKHADETLVELQGISKIIMKLRKTLGRIVVQETF